MPPFPDFTNSTLFPTFASLPLVTDDVSPDPPPYHLIGTISENMTLSTSPTFICKDPSGSPFALTLRIPAALVKAGVQGGGYDVSGFKKGFAVVVPGARRSGVSEGKQGFVEIPVGEVKIIPASVKKLTEMGDKGKVVGRSESEGRECCQACGKEVETGKLSRCKGCESIWYCDKNCQRLGWNEKGHKGECKVYRAVNAAFPDRG